MIPATTFSGAKVPANPKVSIVTPCFNCACYLTQALNSVKCLSNTIELEHVVADGGSTDGTLQLLERAPLVRGISRPDEGLYAALNWAISQARGDYIQWLNGDDELPDEGFLERTIALLESEPRLDLVLGTTIFVDRIGKEFKRWEYDARAAVDLERQAGGYFFNINSMVIRRTTLLRMGDFDQKSFPIGADRDFEIRLVSTHPRIAFLPIPAYRFRVNPGSLTSGAGAKARCMLETAQIFDKWSRVSGIPHSARMKFAVRSKEMFLGLSLKEIRSHGSFVHGFRSLVTHLTTRPHLVPQALWAWASHRIMGETEPMRAV